MMKHTFYDVARVFTYIYIYIYMYIYIYIIPRTSKTSEMVSPFQNNSSPVKKTVFSNKPSFCVCVCTCLAKPVMSYTSIDLLSLQTQPPTMK